MSSQLELTGYINEGKLGEGGMGKVWKCRDIVTNKLYAVKEMDMQDFKARRTQLIDRSHELLEEYNSPFLVQYFKFCESDSGQKCFVFEYLPGGDLYHRLRKAEEVPRVVAVRWVREITSALCYLHSKNLIHRDVKASNVMLTSTDLMLASAKLSDFDTMRTINFGMTEGIGTDSHRAPETGTSLYNEKADIWSLGCLTYGLLKRNANPFSKGDPANVRTGPNCQDLDPLAADFIQRCLAYDPRSRPSASELLQHRFLEADNSLAIYLQSFVDNSLLQARSLSTFSLTDGYSVASNAYRSALETLDVCRDRQVAGIEQLQAKVEELAALTTQLVRHIS